MDTYLEFAANHTLLVSALLFSFFMVIFSELRRKAQGITHLDPQDAVKLINADATVVDLRSAEAYARGHIVNAKNIPLEEFTADSDKVKRLGDKPIVTYCDAGITSNRAVGALRKSGRESVYGIKAESPPGTRPVCRLLPIRNEEQQRQQVVPPDYWQRPTRSLATYRITSSGT